MNEVEVATATDVQTQVEASIIGKALKVEIDRKGEVKTLKVKPTKMPNNLQ